VLGIKNPTKRKNPSANAGVFCPINWGQFKENEYLREENAYLKKLDALIQEKKLAAQQKRRK
jgi:hypothetical protein